MTWTIMRLLFFSTGTFALIMLLSANPLRAIHNSTLTLETGELVLIRGEGESTVYYRAPDKKRYVFPNVGTYFSWFGSFDGRPIGVLSDAELQQIPLGGENVMYRPGKKLVKIQTDPKVYAVERGGLLRHVTSEGIAAELYGESWADEVDDIPDTFFTNYEMGEPINSAFDYSSTTAMNSAHFPYHNFKEIPTLTVSMDKIHVENGEVATVTATAHHAPEDASALKMELHLVWTNALVGGVCTGSLNCTFEVPIINRPGESGWDRFYVKLLTSDDRELARSPLRLFTVEGAYPHDGENYITDLEFETDETVIQEGARIRLTSNAINTGDWDYVGNKQEIVDLRLGNIIQTCENQSWCVANPIVRRLGSETSVQYEVRHYDRNGRFVMNALSPVVAIE